MKDRLRIFESHLALYGIPSSNISHVLLSTAPARGSRTSKKPWIPAPIALNCYRPPDKWFFEGLGLNHRSKMTGRESEWKSLKRIVDGSQKGDKTAVSTTSNSGIGYLMLSPYQHFKIVQSLFATHSWRFDLIEKQRLYSKSYTKTPMRETSSFMPMMRLLCIKHTFILPSLSAPSIPSKNIEVN